MDAVLVLNATYEPLTFVPVPRAVVLQLLGKAEILEAHSERVLRSEHVSAPWPRTIRLLRFVHIPYRARHLPFSRHGVLRRDEYTCQYCGATEQLTIDHVLPRSRGGRSEWANCVTSCFGCNHRKGNRTPEEAGLTLRRPPAAPVFEPFGAWVS